ncbi:transketolase [Treponema pedis]|uniref:transketolase n=1 Tax=Treponema pedis TaxID=409322 RepID=UPI0004947B32|nr:transketolase [Treponema pedis]
MKNELDAVALSIRSLSMDAIEKANSGHPGLPLGAAELAASLYGKILKHNPLNPEWKDRDRFVLSAGHGSMLLYSILHISGYDVSLEDIKSFRQLGSKCPGHPEYGDTPGVETTTGPLGQGIATAVGMAIAEKMLAAEFNEDGYKIVDHYTYVLVGEGCLMEGVASEASSLAGHLKLGKLIVYYDENKITIDGSTDITFTEDIAARYKAYGWQVLQGSMYSYEDIEHLTAEAKKDERPTLIMLKSVIGQGAPTVAGKNKAHGAPLGKDGITEAKKNLGLDPSKEFFVFEEAYSFFKKRREELSRAENEWNNTFEQWSCKYPEKRKEWDMFFSKGGISKELIKSVVLPQFKKEEAVATRSASKKVLNEFAKTLTNLVGGSADLEGPNAVGLDGIPSFTDETPQGRYLRYGIREFAMGTITNGIQLHGGFRAFCATFLVFADYLRPSLRLAALMKLPSIFVLTHDSVYVGEDGPTHQPVELLASLRAIPNVLVLRPADAEETGEAWALALQHTDGPVCLILSRQNLPVLEKADAAWREHFKNGAYIVKDVQGVPDITVLATGSEVSTAVKAASLVNGKKVRVVSVPSKELFENSCKDTIHSVLGGCKKDIRIITAEAGIRQGWEGWTKCKCDNFSIEQFGTSAPGSKVAEHLGFTAEKLAELIEK